MHREVRQAVRRLLSAPAFTLVALLTLALGTGATVAVFSVVYSVLLRPLPYADPERLVALSWTSEEAEVVPLSLVEVEEWQRSAGSLSGLAAYHPWGFTLTGGEQAERLRAAVTTADMFQVLGVEPQLGRVFTADGPGEPPVVLLGHELWQRRFGGRPGIVGEKLLLSGEPYEVIGVMPEGFRFPPGRSAELWSANRAAADDVPREMRYLLPVGRLAEGSSLAAARAEMAAVAERHGQRHPETNAGLAVRVRPLLDTVVQDSRQALLLVQAAVLLVLAIACLNLAVLQLVRVARRRNDLAVSLALGARRGQIARQVLVESVVLGLAGGALGLLVGLAGVRLLVRFGPRDIHRLEQAGLHGTVLLFAFGLALACGVLFALLPAWASFRGGLGPLLGAGGHRVAGGTRRGHDLLVFVEIAAALVLLVGAGLLVRSFVQLSTVPVGLRTDHLLTMQFSLPESYASLERTAAFHQELEEEVEALPGVESVAWCVSLPVDPNMTFDAPFEIEGRPRTADQPQRAAQIRPVSPGYFATLEVPVVAGRVFTPEDRAGTRGVVVVNQEAARRWWPESGPVGERLRLGLDLGPSFGRIEEGLWEVVGVVADVRHDGLDRPVPPEIYFSTAQSPWMVHNLLVRTSTDPAGLADAVRREIRDLEADLPVTSVRTMDEVLADVLAPSRFRTWLVGLFALLALALAAVGLYGVLAYSVIERRREIGVRVALGARRASVVWMVVRRGLVVTLAGIAAGLAGALLAGRALSGLLFGVPASEPATLLAVSTLLLAVAAVASLLPALRAAGFDPVQSLRND